jgi:DNA invertase Pin-like site-specific DNA recombinase
VLERLLPGDTLEVWRLDRLGRSLRHLIDVVTPRDERGVGFRSLNESIDTTTAGGRLVHLFGAMAEFEPQLIRDRTLAGLQTARSRGRRGGRPPKLTPAKLREAKRMHATGTTMTEIGDAKVVVLSDVAAELAERGQSLLVVYASGPHWLLGEPELR